MISAGDPIKIGMGSPLTGDNASFGIDISQGAAVALEDAGEVEGFKFELVSEDDGGAPEGGAAVANKLVSDPGVVAVAGHIFSGATQAAIPIYEKVGIPMMSPSATNPALTTTGSMVFNRLVFTDAAQGKFAAEYLYDDLGFKRVAVMHDGQAYGQGLAQVVNDEFTALGGEVTDFQTITPGESDYSAPLAAIAANSPEALYYGGYVQEAVVLVNGMKSAGLTDTIFFGCGRHLWSGLPRPHRCERQRLLRDVPDPGGIRCQGRLRRGLRRQVWHRSGQALPLHLERLQLSGRAGKRHQDRHLLKGDDGNLYIQPRRPSGMLCAASKNTRVSAA